MVKGELIVDSATACGADSLVGRRVSEGTRCDLVDEPLSFGQMRSKRIRWQRVPSLTRRATLTALETIALFATWFSAATLFAAEPTTTTHVYKTVGQLGIKADVIASEASAPRPVVVWIHGGALINGHRASVPKWMKDEFLPRGYAIVSLDYRLAPENKLPDIVADVEDAFAWIRQQGPKRFAADPKRIAVAGGSAGGYLTLVTGFRVEPRPRALVSLWGYGDLGAPWTYEASQHARHASGTITADAIAALPQGPAVADSRERKGDGGGFYQHSRRSGTWAAAVSGWNPTADADKFTPFMPERNVTAQYPPTFIIHGDADTDVPYDSSAGMDAALAKAGVEHKLIRFAGAEHGLPGVDPAKVNAAYHEAAEFVAAKLEAKR